MKDDAFKKQKRKLLRQEMMSAEAKKDLLDDSFKYNNKKLDPFKKMQKKDVKFQKIVMF